MNRALALLLLSGCTGLAAPRPLPVHHFRAEASAVEPVRRVMVLPFDAVDNVAADTERIRAEVLQALIRAQRCEVTPLPRSAPEITALYHGVTRGDLSAETLAQLRDRYRIDGVVLGTVTAWRPYAPTHLGLRVRLVSLISGETVWAADGMWDSNDARVQEDIRHYAGSFQAEQPSMHEWRINLISPTRYAAYVAHRIVATLRAP